MDVYLASPRGFCAGVDLAVDIVDLAIQQYGTPVYVKHQIVHNPKVVADVEAKGAITVEKVEEVPEGAVVVFSAHGSPPSDYAIARERNLVVLDATCPLVTRVHNEAKKYTKEGKKIVLVGHIGHQEVIGTTGQADMTLIDERQDWELPDWGSDAEVAVLTQTTLSVNDTALAVAKIKKSHPNAVVRDDICYATTNRQAAATELADMTELVLVIGAQSSSNCNRLKDVAIKKGVPAHLINGPEELDRSWLQGVEKIGITSGASTPEKQVKAVIEAISPENVYRVGTGEESITFAIPRNLRNMVGDGIRTNNEDELIPDENN
ncbi:MAG: 4-hydroxy-3-methylbut-2-enyl diphosphate reductase [Chloroflexi bacterium]|nr:4-hydroxy-3-methylbut-2-enyl diphosphate reductase [Chloroflexota bacterium]MDA1282275.1 4-hydroxy-3-methylbut-2-enyl diphosphate reductase [Chloroflexota bacterium]